MGLLTELRASFATSHSGSEIILVRLHRLRAGREPAGRRENFAETLSRDELRQWSSYCVCFRVQDQSRRCGFFEWAHDPRDGLQRYLLESRSLSPQRSDRGAAGVV